MRKNECFFNFWCLQVKSSHRFRSQIHKNWILLDPLGADPFRPEKNAQHHHLFFWIPCDSTKHTKRYVGKTTAIYHVFFLNHGYLPNHGFFLPNPDFFLPKHVFCLPNHCLTLFELEVAVRNIGRTSNL